MESKSIFKMEGNRACRLLGIKQWRNSDDEERRGIFQEAMY